MKKPEGFMIFHEWKHAFELLPAESAKRLLIALFDYSESQTEPELTEAEIMAFGFMQRAIDRAHTKYYERCLQNSKNANASKE